MQQQTKEKAMTKDKATFKIELNLIHLSYDILLLGKDGLWDDIGRYTDKAEAEASIRNMIKWISTFPTEAKGLAALRESIGGYEHGRRTSPPHQTPTEEEVKNMRARLAKLWTDVGESPEFVARYTNKGKQP
jgi:hypothetical protein